MINAFEEMLTGGHPNSLGRTVEVVDIILKDKSKLSDLYDCYSSKDEVVRLRVSSAFKRITKAKPEWMIPYADLFIEEISYIDQPSAQWSFAQIMLDIDDRLSTTQRNGVISALKRNLESSDDWIVLNTTMEALTSHAKDSRKSVAKRAQKYLEEL